MQSINNDVFFVRGAVNGAIYDLSSGKVFSINGSACEIVERYCSNSARNDDEGYLSLLRREHLIDPTYRPRDVEVEECDDNLEMAWLEITQACNLRCLHCYEGSEHKSCEQPLSMDEWRSVIEQLKALRPKRIVIIGGEPCCHRKLLEIMKCVSDFELDATLFTNATLLSDEVMGLVERIGMRVKVSVYGHCAEVHDRVTGVKGSFDRMSRAVKRLTDRGVFVEAAIIIMRENQDCLSETIDRVRQLGMHYRKFDAIRDVFGGNQSEHAVTNRDILSRVYMTKANFKITRERFIKNINRNSCWHGKLVVTENGDVLPCVFERECVYGNVRRQSLKEILKGDEAKRCWHMDFSRVQACRDCEFRFACHDCRPLARGATGMLDGKNPRCLYDVYKGRWRGLDGE